MQQDLFKYREKGYWDTRYEEEDVFEWFHGLDKFQYLLLPAISQKDNILVLGCGNSRMSEELYRQGYKNITNIDFSEVVISKMAARTAQMKGMKWLVMDMLKLEFPNESFDLVLDKGSIDSLMVDQGDPWNPSAKSLYDCKTALMEASRVTRSGGIFVSITFSQPHFRGHMMADSEFDWSVIHSTFGEGFQYFFYTATKGQKLENGFNYSYPDLYNSKITCADLQYLHDSDDENFITKINL